MQRLRKEFNMTQAKLYYNRIILGQTTFEKVPERHKANTRLYARQQVEAGKLTPWLYENLFDEPFED